MGTLFPKKYETISHGTGDYDINGNWVPGSDIDSFFMGSMQPMTGKEIESLTVGRADIGKMKIYSDRILKVSRDGGDEAGEIIKFNNQRWEVIDELNYDSDLIPHFKYIAEFRENVSI